MSIPEAKLQSIQDQVNSKIHWDESAHNVEEWLEEKHGITGDHAAAMLAKAALKRRIAIRERAFYLIILTLIGMSIPATYLTVQWLARRFSLFLTPISIFLFLAALSLFWRGLSRFLTGETDAPIDP